MNNLTHVFYVKSLLDVSYTTDPQTLDASKYEYVVSLTEETIGEHGIFRVMNVVDGDRDIEVPLKIRCRSMSVGDLYVKEGKAFYCAPAGWVEITNRKFISDLSKMNAERVV